MRGKRTNPIVQQVLTAAKAETVGVAPPPPKLTAIERMAAREAESAAAEREAYEAGTLSPLSRVFHECLGVEFEYGLYIADPVVAAKWGEALRQMVEEDKREEDARRDTMEDALIASQPVRPLSNASATSINVRRAIVDKCRELFERDGRVRGTDVARALNISDAAVSVARNVAVSELLANGEPVPPWLISSTRAARIRKVTGE